MIINEKNKECSSCHSSFDMQKKMMTGGSSVGEYTIGDEPPKIMAYVPLQLNDEKWILTISTLLPKVTASLRGKFNLFFGLGIIILLVIFSFGFLLYFINSKRVAAEEASLLLRQRQRFQDQLNHAGKLASIGELVDTVAHEINTPLSVISSYTDLLMMQTNNPPEVKSDLEIIKKQTLRAGKYTRSLLSYSKRLPFNPQLISIKNLIDECLFLLDYRIRIKRVRIVKKYIQDIPFICLDNTQMEQVIINILNNALDASEINGDIIIGIDVKNVRENSNDNTLYQSMEISITDEGTGIAQENIGLIFEPFYSTKGPREGTGLGLAISKAIITRHRGRIEVQSELEKFTKFIITLPMNNKSLCSTNEKER